MNTMTFRRHGRNLCVWLAFAGLVGCSTAPVAPTSPPKLPTDTSAVTPPLVREEPPPAPKRPLKLGLALGGGAARGFAHVGVIQVLEEAGISPSLVVGTSAGSLVAAFYASGKNGAQLQRVSETMDEATLTRMAAERRIPSLEKDGAWVFSRKSIDKWRRLQEKRPASA